MKIEEGIFYSSNIIMQKGDNSNSQQELT